METSFDLMLWRALLIDGAPVPNGHDLLEWAQRLENAGEHEASALLTDVAVLHQGFSPQAIASRARLSSDPALFAGAPLGQGSTLHHAVSELRALAGVAAALDLPKLAETCPFIASGRPDSIAGIGNGVRARQPIEDIAIAARELRHSLEGPFSDGIGLKALLDGLVEAGQRYGPINFKSYASAPLSILVPQIAAAALIDFALSSRDLWSSPLGSPKLFYYAARLDSRTLGPYFSNVPQLVRSSRDVIDLACLAFQASLGQDDPDGNIMAWIVLLSRCFQGERLLQIIDDLGDSNAQRALLAILNRVVSRPDPLIDRETVMRLRDAGLDNAEYVLAAHAQQVLARLSPDNITEGRIMGEIEASRGAFERAEAIFRYWLTRMPGDDDLSERFKAAKMREFDRFAITSGFGSPADRRETRARRRGLEPQYTRRMGERVRAVDLG